MPTTTKFPPEAPKTDDPWMPEDVVHTADLVPYAKTADVMVKPESISGWKKTTAQTLQHDTNGKLKWVDNASE